MTFERNAAQSLSQCDLGRHKGNPK